MVGARGFEPPTSATPRQRASQATLRPDPGRGARIAAQRGTGKESGPRAGEHDGARTPIAYNKAVPRLYRSLRAHGVSARRRHRTWMLSMCLATIAWGCWWTDLVLARLVPDFLPNIALVAGVANVFAGLGFLAGLLCLRGRNRLWIALAFVPILANACLFATPFLLRQGERLQDGLSGAPISGPNSASGSETGSGSDDALGTEQHEDAGDRRDERQGDDGPGQTSVQPLPASVAPGHDAGEDR